MHHEYIHEPLRSMLVSFGQYSNDLKAKRFPKIDRHLVGADNEIELHGLITLFFRVSQRLLAELAGDALAAELGMDDERSVGDVPCPPRPVRADRGHARHLASCIGHETNQYPLIICVQVLWWGFSRIPEQ